jgi:hypothetical protein
LCITKIAINDFTKTIKYVPKKHQRKLVIKNHRVQSYLINLVQDENLKKELYEKKNKLYNRYPKTGTKEEIAIFWQSFYLSEYHSLLNIIKRQVHSQLFYYEQKLVKELTNYLGLDFTRGYYYSLYKEKDEEGQKKIVKTNKYFYTNTLLSHFHGITQKVLPKFPYSKYFILDIDNNQPINPKTKKKYTTKEVVKTFIEWIKCRPFYIEHNRMSRGYHLYYHFDKVIKDHHIKTLVKDFKDEFGMLIEPIRYSNAIRVPFDRNYYTAGFYNPTEKTLITTLFNRKNYDFLEKLLKRFKQGYENPKKLPSKFHKYTTQTGNLYEFSYANNVSKDNWKEIDKNFSYGLGTRHQAQGRIAFHVLHNNGTYHDFYDLCVRYDHGSKDMARDSFKITDFVWNSAQSAFNPSYRSGNNFSENELYFNSNYTLTSEERKYIEALIRVQIQKEKIEANETYYEKNFSRKIEECISVFTFLKQKHEYFIKKHKERKAKKESMKFLENGILFDEKTQKKVADFFGIKNIKSVIKLLEKTSLMETLKNEYGHSHNFYGDIFAKHVSLNSPKEQFNQFINNLKVVSKTIKTKILNKLINIKSSLLKVCNWIINTILENIIINHENAALTQYKYIQESFKVKKLLDLQGKFLIDRLRPIKLTLEDSLK